MAKHGADVEFWRVRLEKNLSEKNGRDFLLDSSSWILPTNSQLTFSSLFLICLVLRLPWRVVFSFELSKTSSELSKTAQIKKTIALWFRMSASPLFFTQIFLETYSSELNMISMLCQKLQNLSFDYECVRKFFCFFFMGEIFRFVSSMAIFVSGVENVEH